MWQQGSVILTNYNDGNNDLFTSGEGKNSDDVARQSGNKEGNAAGKAK